VTPVTQVVWTPAWLIVTLPTGLVTPVFRRLTVALLAAPVFAVAVNVTPVEAVPVVDESESHVAFSERVHEQPTPVAVTLIVPVPPWLPTFPLGVETAKLQGSPAAWRTVAEPEGPPARPVSLNVTVAVRWATVGFAAKLTVTTWLLVPVAGATEVIQVSLAVAVQAQLVPPVVNENVVADAPFPTSLKEGDPTVKEHGGLCVMV
jgi:hypothetical protein